MAIMTVIIGHKAPTGKECALSTNYRLLSKMIKEYECDKVRRQKCRQRGVRLFMKAPKSSQAFTFYAGQKFRFYLRYPWKLQVQVL